jgi:capsular exopolysaccharide synthesis family protein
MTQGPGGVVISDPLVLRLKELEKNLTTLSAEYKDNYPDIIYLKQEIQTLKELIKNKVGRDDASAKPSDSTNQREIKTPDLYLRELVRQRDEVKLEIASLKERLARTKDQMKEYESRVEKTPSREQELEILVRDYNNLKENYRTLLDKKLNARLAENLEKRQKGEQFRIVDPANLPTKPEKPNRVNIMLIGLALGCGLGVGSAIGMESFRPVFRRPDDVESLLQLRVLAAIPNYKGILASTRKALPGNAIAPVSGRIISGRFLPVNESGSRQNGKYEKKLAGEGLSSSDLESPRILKQTATLREFELIGKWSPWSVVAEQFRVAATRLALSLATERGKVAVITSAVKGEGKSAVAANLAYALARDMGKATLLIDGDLKCPTLHQYLGVRQSPGLRDVLQGTRSVDSCIHQEGELPLWTLPSGTEANRVVDLSRINQISARLEELRGKFDYIIIDAPPILPLADMHMFARMADILILVIRAGLTPRKIVENAVRTLGATNVHIILNGLETGGVPSYMREGYEYALERSESSNT